MSSITNRFLCFRRWSTVTVGIWLTVLVTFPSTLLHAQQERLELGQRLRRFELAWQAATPEVRERSVAPMKSAVQSFFSFQLQSAGRQLDAAYLALLPASDATELRQFAISRMLKLNSRVSETTSREISFQVEPFYKVEFPAPPGTMVSISLQTASGQPVCEAQFQLAETIVGCTLSLPELQEGDYRLRASLQTDGQPVVFAERNWSYVTKLTERLKEIDRATDKLPDGSLPTVLKPTDRLSIQQLSRWISAGHTGENLEIDYPAARLIKLCEELLSQPSGTSDIWRRTAEQGDTWMTLAADKQQAVVRLRCPQKPTGPMPVLFAMHGAGGSENMFFETYGAGRLVELALQRGWMVVAPRQGLFGLGMNCSQMVENLRQFYDIDTSRIFLLGHSMGAMQVVTQSQLQPTLPRAAVAVGGGGRLSRSNQPFPFPWLVAAGELDFGRGAAQNLADGLKKTGTPVQYLEFPKVEHMVIVQAALDDVFRFLDETSQR